MDGVLVEQTSRDRFDLMAWATYGKEIWDGIKKHRPTLLSKIPDAFLAKAYAEKRLWADEHLGTDAPLIVVPDSLGKSVYALPGDVLIDDSLANCREWRARGGLTIWHQGAQTVGIIKNYYGDK